MTDYCNNCNGTGYVREGYDGEAPCDWCRPDDHHAWELDQWRQAENMLSAYKKKVEQLTDEINRLNQAHRWVSVEDRMPDKRGCYLWMTTLGNQPTWSFYDPEWNSKGSTTHWMPLPEPPSTEAAHA